MILLDTNVVSEAMKPAPDPRVIDWLDSLPASDVWISAVTAAEIHLGLALLPNGKHGYRQNFCKWPESGCPAA